MEETHDWHGMDLEIKPEITAILYYYLKIQGNRIQARQKHFSISEGVNATIIKSPSLYLLFKPKSKICSVTNHFQ